MTPWGYHLVIDLYGCNPEKVRSGEEIKKWVVEVCDLIKMTRYGEPTLIRFGKDPAVSGYSLCQFIEESNVSGHFIEESNSVCLDIFSCKEFSYFTAARFTKDFFEATDVSIRSMKRLDGKIVLSEVSIE